MGPPVECAWEVEAQFLQQHGRGAVWMRGERLNAVNQPNVPHRGKYKKRHSSKCLQGGLVNEGTAWKEPARADRACGGDGSSVDGGHCMPGCDGGASSSQKMPRQAELPLVRLQHTRQQLQRQPQEAATAAHDANSAWVSMQPAARNIRAKGPAARRSRAPWVAEPRC